jgi:hypothetical protein
LEPPFQLGEPRQQHGILADLVFRGASATMEAIRKVRIQITTTTGRTKPSGTTMR